MFSFFGYDKKGFKGRTDAFWITQMRRNPKAKYDLADGGLKVISILEKALNTPDPIIRGDAAECLTTMAQRPAERPNLPVVAKRVGPSLNKMLFNDTDENRWKAGCALDKLPFPDDQRLVIFARALADPFPTVRALSLIALGRMRQKAAPVADIIVASIGDPSKDGEIDRYAIEVMAHIGNTTAVPALRQAASNGNVRATVVADLLESGKYDDFNYCLWGKRNGASEVARVAEIISHALRSEQNIARG